MLYLVALICPPLALLCCGRFLGAIANLIFSIIGAATAMLGIGIVILIGCIIHAWMAVKATKTHPAVGHTVIVNNTNVVGR
jgi:hypothetical protein